MKRIALAITLLVVCLPADFVHAAAGITITFTTRNPLNNGQQNQLKWGGTWFTNGGDNPSTVLAQWTPAGNNQ